MLDQRNGAALAQPVHEVLHARVDDDLGLRHRRLAAVLAGLHHIGQVVDGVEVDVGQRLDLGLDVARHGQVNHEHGPVLAQFHGALDRAQANDGQRAGGAADDRVELVQAAGQVGQAHHFGAKAAGELFAALQRAVGNRHRLGVAGSKVRGRQVNHFAGADKQNLDFAQILEQLAGQAHRRCRHADAVRANLGAGAHLLGHGKRALEQLVQRRAHGAGVACGAHGVFHLPQDLRLAQHHRVQPAGDAKGVACGLVALQRVGMAAQQTGRNAAVVRQPVQRAIHVVAVADAVDFGAVAGGEQRCLGLARQRGAQSTQGGLDLIHRIGETAAQIERCGVMVKPQGPD